MNTLPELHLRDIDSKIVDAWCGHFRDADGVFVSQGDITDYPIERIDAIVSPANSFGFMTGGIDAVYVGWLGRTIETNVQTAIDTRSFGELPVGQALVAATGSDKVRWVIAAPTMRLPMRVDPVNAYLSTRAALIAVLRHNATSDYEHRIYKILCPGMGTLTGRIDPMAAAHAMRAAYEQVRNPVPTGTLETRTLAYA